VIWSAVASEARHRFGLFLGHSKPKRRRRFALPAHSINKMNLKDKSAIVTGATKGIGRAIAAALVGEGISVCISARNQGEIDAAVQELNRSDHGKAIGFVCDVRDYDQVKALIDHAAKELGGVDILINNAGIGMFETVAETSPEDFREVLETNLFGVFYCCHEAIPQMKRSGGGYIINISSLAGVNAHPRMAAYNASKFGLNGFSEALMQEVYVADQTHPTS